jgi:hypothetical protein
VRGEGQDPPSASSVALSPKPAAPRRVGLDFLKMASWSSRRSTIDNLLLELAEILSAASRSPNELIHLALLQAAQLDHTRQGIALLCRPLYECELTVLMQNSPPSYNSFAPTFSPSPTSRRSQPSPLLALSLASSSSELIQAFPAMDKALMGNSTCSRRSNGDGASECAR